MHRLAIVALFDFVVAGKLFPVTLLVGVEAPRSLADRAGVFQSQHNGLANELALVGEPMDDLSQCVIDFEGDDLVLHGATVLQGHTFVKAWPFLVFGVRVWWGMRTLLLLLVLLLTSGFLWADTDEFVNWGAGLSLEKGQAFTINGIELQVTWDEAFSARMSSDFPRIAKGTMSSSDLLQLHTTYGLSTHNRRFTLNVVLNGKPLLTTLILKAARQEGKNVTLDYLVPVRLVIESSTDLSVELFDPTANTDMGIRGHDGAFFVHVSAAQRRRLSFEFLQDFDHPYNGGTAYPQAVVFHLRP